MSPYPSLSQEGLRVQAMRIRHRLPAATPQRCQDIARSIRWDRLGPPPGPTWKSRLVQEVGTWVRRRRIPGLSGNHDILCLVCLIMHEVAQNSEDDLKGAADAVKESGTIHELFGEAAGRPQVLGQTRSGRTRP